VLSIPSLTVHLPRRARHTLTTFDLPTDGGSDPVSTGSRRLVRSWWNRGPPQALRHDDTAGTHPVVSSSTSRSGVAHVLRAAEGTEVLLTATGPRGPVASDDTLAALAWLSRHYIIDGVS